MFIKKKMNWKYGEPLLILTILRRGEEEGQQD